MRESILCSLHLINRDLIPWSYQFENRKWKLYSNAVEKFLHKRLWILLYLVKINQCRLGKLKISFWSFLQCAFLSHSQSNATANIVWSLNFSHVWNCCCRNQRYWFWSNFTKVLLHHPLHPDGPLTLITWSLNFYTPTHLQIQKENHPL